MKVWRVENVNQIGPYTGPTSFQYDMEQLGKSHDDRKHPIQYTSTDWGSVRYGFASYADFRGWFDSFGNVGYKYLADNGFVLSKYEVPDSFVDRVKKQVIFYFDHARLIQSYDIPEYFEVL